jgi:hypothetical protein
MRREKEAKRGKKKQKEAKKNETYFFMSRVPPSFPLYTINL